MDRSLVASAEEMLWIAELCGNLVTGASESEARTLAIRSGAKPCDVDRVVGQLRSLPAFSRSRDLNVRLRCRNWLLGAYAALAELRSDPAEIDRLDFIAQKEFLLDYYSTNRPLLLPRLASEWRAVKYWGRDYLKAQCGSEFVDVMMGRDGASVPDQNAGDSLRQRIRFADYIDFIYSTVPTNNCYLVARSRFFASPATAILLEDFGPLSFVNTRADTADIKLWLGPRGTYTPLHYDPRNNLLVQVIGTKTIRLYAPYFAPQMYQTKPWYAEVDPGLNGHLEGMASTCRAAEITVNLVPGDALFIPVGWWHAVSATSVGATLNFHDFGVPNAYQFEAVRPT